jgi:Chaperone of endosialidase
MGERPATRDSERQPARKREYVKPTLIAHGRLQAFTAAEGGPVSGAHPISGDAAPSDARLKHGAESLPDGALAQVIALRPVEFSWIDTGTRQAGFIAQDVEAVMPQAVVRREGSDLRHIDYGAIISLLTKAVQELQAEVAELRNKLQGETSLRGGHEG